MGEATVTRFRAAVSVSGLFRSDFQNDYDYASSESDQTDGASCLYQRTDGRGQGYCEPEARTEKNNPTGPSALSFLVVHICVLSYGKILRRQTQFGIECSVRKRIGLSLRQ